MGNTLKLLILSFVLGFNFAAFAESSLSKTQREIRVQHARELLGNHYRTSVVKKGEKVTKINNAIYLATRDHLPKSHRKQYKKVAQAIIDEATKHEFDPVFLLSVIQGESSFDPNMRGKLDEIGLMQIRPATGEWIAKMYDIPWKGPKSLFDPVTNIRIGAAFLAHLREQFDSHARLYIAAYNMGARNVNKAREQDIWPRDYPIHVMKLYVAFYSELSVPSTRRPAKM